MLQQRPPSPPPSNGDDMHYGIQLLAQHNSSYHYPPGQTRNQSPQQPGTKQEHDPNLCAVNLYGCGQVHGNDNVLYAQSSSYPDILPEQQTYHYHAPATVHTPPTPASEEDNVKLAQDGRLLNFSPSPGTDREENEQLKSPKAKKTPKLKGEKPKIPKITAPLSRLTKDLNHVPVRNMEEWVNRSIETRRKEVQKRNGYVTRPMNSFMLYRSAYAERTKLWCLQNNHQVVSAVSGESWPLEPTEVRDHYNELAKIERDNHQKAHPGYKFCPSKNQSTAKKRKEAAQDDASDLDEIDLDWEPSGTRRSKFASPKRQKEMAKSSPKTYPGSKPNNLNKSSYQMTNPGKPVPNSIADRNEFMGQYYQTTIHPHSWVSNVEDVSLRRTESPSTQYGSAPSLISLPGSSHYDLLPQLPHHEPAMLLNEPNVDPLLLAFDSNHVGHVPHNSDSSFGSMYSPPTSHSYSSHDDFFGSVQHMEGYHTPIAMHPGMQTLTDGTESWTRDGDPNVMDSEFKKWMEESHSR